MTRQKIFFSYSRVDGSAFALRLAVDLKKKGFDVWIDQEDIRAGLDWDTEIEKALESCDYVLFLETEKSVVSNNVLDEVYYALDQNKKVIPVIYVDSKTPYRLNRLQHIDFTKNYDTGLALLVNELEGNTPAITYQPDEKTPSSAHNKPFYIKNYRPLLVIACLAVLVTAAVVLTTKNKNAPVAETQRTTALTDTVTGKTGPPTIASAIPVTDSAERNEPKSKEKITATENKKDIQDKKVVASSVPAGSGSAKAIQANAESHPNKLNEMVAGDWQLMSVQPAAQSQRGYLKIEASDDNKATIKSYMQFYYPDSKSPPYLTIFNAFAGCSSCIVRKEMKLKVEDIAVGSTNSNKSVHGTATLQFVDNNNAVIKIKQPLTVELANGSMLEPFVCTFHFKKID